jgi:hypothetical protein
MKAEIKFEFGSEIEMNEWLHTQNVNQMAARTLGRLRYELRQDYKYGDGEMKSDAIAQRLFEIAQEEGLDAWEL